MSEIFLVQPLTRGELADAVWLEYKSVGQLHIKEDKENWLGGKNRSRKAKEEGGTPLSTWN